jgi:acetyltransferase-like isoleucine patch superfamily enzyme
MEIMPHPFRLFFFKIIFKNIGKNFLIDYKTYFRYPKKISIGHNVSINRGCEFYASFLVQEGYIKIGNDVTFSPHVKLFAIGHTYNNFGLEDFAAPITIGNNVWIGANSTILPGVKIGDGAIIGAGSLVLKDIPSGTVSFGVPTKVVKQRDGYF